MESFTPTVFRFLLLMASLPVMTSLPDPSRARMSGLPLNALQSADQTGLSENQGQDILQSLKKLDLVLLMVKNMRQRLDAARRNELDSTKRFGPRNHFLRVGRASSAGYGQNSVEESDADAANNNYLDLLRTLRVLRAHAPSIDDGNAFPGIVRSENDRETDSESNELLGIHESVQPKNSFPLLTGRSRPRSFFLRIGRARPMSNFVRIGRARPMNSFVRIGRARPMNSFVRIGRRSPRSHFIRIGKRSVRSVFNEEQEAEDNNNNNNSDEDESGDRDQYDPHPLTFEREARNGAEANGEDEDRERFLQQLLRLQRRSTFVRIGRLPASVYLQRQRMFSGRDGRPQSLGNLSRRRSRGYRLTESGIVRAGKRASDLD